MATSLAVNTFLAIGVDKSKRQEHSDYYMSSLENMCNLVVQHIEGDAVEFMAGNVQLTVNRSGRVAGFQQYMKHTANHKLTIKMLEDEPPLHEPDIQFTVWEASFGIMFGHGLCLGGHGVLFGMGAF